MAKIIIYLREQELDALAELAMREYRTPKAQASLLIQKELERLELLEKGLGKQEEKHDGQ
ncbi:MAG: hypothetical protein HZB50_03670 [Chloroflexi bacterium]|nr:hypothetical protein [Chloroflexota bacterium]